MRILLIHQVFLSSKEGGGTRHFELGRFAVKRGHEFVAIASDVSYLDGSTLGEAGKLEELDGVKILRAHMPGVIHRSFTWRVLAFVAFMFNSARAALSVGKVDVVMGTTPPLFQALSAWFVSFVRRRPLLLEIRDLWPDFAIEMGVLKNPVLIWLSRRLEVFLYRRARHIMVNSPAYRDYLIDQRGIKPEKVTVIPNGVDPSMFDPDLDGSLIRQRHQLNGKFVVTYAGALGPANDIPTILRAADRLRDLPDVHFLLVGGGKDRTRIEQMIHERKLENVTLAGVAPKDEMAQILAAADVCVATLMPIPMFKTTYPNKIFDYMAAGRPIVLGIDGVIRDVVEQGQAGIFVTPGDDEAMAGAITELRSDPERRREMARTGRRHVCEHFNRMHQAEEFVDLAERIAAARRESLLPAIGN